MIGNAAGKRLVTAVFTPGLGNGFQFDVRWGSTEVRKIALDGLHFSQLQVELSRTAELHQTLIVEIAERHVLKLKIRVSPNFQLVHVEGAKHDLLDGHRSPKCAKQAFERFDCWNWQTSTFGVYEQQSFRCLDR